MLGNFFTKVPAYRSRLNRTVFRIHDNLRRIRILVSYTWLRIRILIFSSVAFKKTSQVSFFLSVFFAYYLMKLPVQFTVHKYNGN